MARKAQYGVQILVCKVTIASDDARMLTAVFGLGIIGLLESKLNSGIEGFLLFNAEGRPITT